MPAPATPPAAPAPETPSVIPNPPSPLDMVPTDDEAMDVDKAAVEPPPVAEAPPVAVDDDPFALDETPSYSCPACRGQKSKHRRDATCRLGPTAASASASAASPDGLEHESDDAPPEYHLIVKESGMQLVSAADVRKSFGADREKWWLAAQHELNSLEGKGVFERLTEEESALLKMYDILPMKVVCGIKTDMVFKDSKKNKVRAVVCGNFKTKTRPEDVYTNNVDVSSVRAALALASERRWSIGALDVNTAFLNADLPAEEGEVVMRPPSLFQHFGLTKPGELWRAKKAIYGLRVSPKAWAVARDVEMRNLRMEYQGETLRLKQSDVDPSVWLVTPEKEPRVESERRLMGIVLTYVDDYIYFSHSELCDKIEDHLARIWKVSAQPRLVYGKGGDLKYLSMTIRGRSDGYLLHQLEYTTDLIEKWGLGAAQGVGTINIENVDDAAVEHDPPLDEIRLAQRMSGGLLWLSGRTRPDIAYSTSKVSSYATSMPRWALRLGKRILRYLIHTRGCGIFYKYRGNSVIWAFADASFDPYTSQTGICVFWGGCLIDWRSVRQQQVARSTAESEITSMSMGALLMEAVEAMFHAMLVDATCVMYGDNTAALCLTHGQGTWRTRALANRAAGIRQRVEDGTLVVDYVRSAEQIADVLTKFLAVPAMSIARQQLTILHVDS